jgi:hypothetical protein
MIISESTMELMEVIGVLGVSIVVAIGIVFYFFTMRDMMRNAVRYVLDERERVQAGASPCSTSVSAAPNATPAK